MVNFEHISHIVLVFLLLTLNIEVVLSRKNICLKPFWFYQEIDVRGATNFGV